MTVETNEIFQFIIDNGFKQTTYKIKGGYLIADYTPPYNIRNDYRLFKYKHITIEFDFEWLTIFNYKKRVLKFTLSTQGWGNQIDITYFNIPENILYFIEHKQVRPKEKRRYIPKKIRQLIFELFSHKCNFCGSPDHLEIDHIYPFSKGGSNNKENLQLLCKPCNRNKFNKLPS